MTSKSMGKKALLVSLPLALALSACATPEAADLRGKWRPVSQFAEAPQAIPLHQSYLYQASPVDNTLKALLSRWARDSKVGLSYLHPNDYTLHAPVAQIRTYSLKQAVDALSAAYASQGVSVTLDGSQIVVRRAGGSTAMATGAEGSGGRE